MPLPAGVGRAADGGRGGAELGDHRRPHRGAGPEPPPGRLVNAQQPSAPTEPQSSQPLSDESGPGPSSPPSLAAYPQVAEWALAPVQAAAGVVQVGQALLLPGVHLDLTLVLTFTLVGGGGDDGIPAPAPRSWECSHSLHSVRTTVVANRLLLDGHSTATGPPPPKDPHPHAPHAHLAEADVQLRCVGQLVFYNGRR
jgi:hypothetical protein